MVYQSRRGREQTTLVPEVFFRREETRQERERSGESGRMRISCYDSCQSTSRDRLQTNNDTPVRLGGQGQIRTLVKSIGAVRSINCCGQPGVCWSTREFRPLIVASVFRSTQGIEGTTVYRYNTFIMNFMANPMIYRGHYKFPIDHACVPPIGCQVTKHQSTSKGTDDFCVTPRLKGRFEVRNLLVE